MSDQEINLNANAGLEAKPKQPKQAAKKNLSKSSKKSVLLSISDSLISKIDAARKISDKLPSRNAWIIDAIMRELERELEHDKVREKILKSSNMVTSNENK
jgi:hypothetical protein